MKMEDPDAVADVSDLRKNKQMTEGNMVSDIEKMEYKVSFWLRDEDPENKQWI